MRKNLKAATSASTNGRFEAVVFTYGVKDYDHDVILPGAAPEGPCLISWWNHASWQERPPVGRGEIVTVGNQARVKGQLFMDTQGGRELFSIMKGLGPELCEFSWSLEGIQAREDFDSDGQPVRYISKVDPIREVSLVIRAASIGSGLVSIGQKSFQATDQEKAAVQKAYLQHLRREMDL